MNKPKLVEVSGGKYVATGDSTASVAIIKAIYAKGVVVTTAWQRALLLFEELYGSYDLCRNHVVKPLC